MAAKPKKLKVYQAQFGFHDSVVAAANQAAALAAWGVRQNLFAEGQASISKDVEATKAALLHPETPLRRTVGSSDSFELEPASLPRVPKGAKKPSSDPKTVAPKTPEKPKVDRRPLTAAEAAVRSLDDKRRRQEASFRRRQEALDAEAAEAQAAYVAARRDAAKTLAETRQRYLAAGGDPSDAADDETS